MKLIRKDLLCEGISVVTKQKVKGWYCEGNVLEGGKDERERISFIIEAYPDLRKCVSLHGFIEVIPESVSLVEIQNNEPE